MNHRLAIVTMIAFTVCFAGRAFGEESVDALVKKVAEGDAAERESGEKQLRAMGLAAAPALRAAKPEKDEAMSRVRNLLTDIAVEASRTNVSDADLLHEIAREEGKGKRYANASKLYGRAEQLYDHLRDDANDRKDKAQAQEFKSKREICDRMKDKAEHKYKGETGTGVNLGFVHIGVKHDVSDDWE